MTVKNIYKYELLPTGIANMPKEADILKVDSQGEKMFIWALVDPGEASVEVKFIIVPTGGAITAEYFQYWDTVFMDNGLVWHIFERTN